MHCHKHKLSNTAKHPALEAQLREVGQLFLSCPCALDDRRYRDGGNFLLTLLAHLASAGHVGVSRGNLSKAVWPVTSGTSRALCQELLPLHFPSRSATTGLQQIATKNQDCSVLDLASLILEEAAQVRKP